jgi:hypothetical protein
MHPLTPSLTNLTDDEVLTKINDLQNRISFSYSMGRPEMIQQLQMVLEDYRFEQQKRQQKLMDELQQTLSKNINK